MSTESLVDQLFDMSAEDEEWLRSIMPCVDVSDYPTSTTHERVLPCLGDSLLSFLLFL